MNWTLTVCTVLILSASRPACAKQVKIKNYQADHWDYALLGGSDAVTAGFHVHLQHFKALEQLGWAPRRQSGYLD